MIPSHRSQRPSAGHLLSRVSLASGLTMLSVLMFTSACNLQQLTANQTADLLLTGGIAVERESDIKFAEDALPASLKTMETFLVASPDNENLHLLLARGYNSYSFAFLEGAMVKGQYEMRTSELEELRRRAVLHYLRARSYAFMLLDRPEFTAACEEGRVDDAQAMLADMEEEDVPGLFWMLQAWAAAVNLSQEDPDMLGALPLLEAVMERLIQLDDDYFFAGPHLVKATYYASKPPMFGGDPELARKHYEIALERHGDEMLLIPFMYGRFYGAQAQDKAHFNKMMKRVLDADVEKYPNTRLANEIARDKARFWLANSDEIFFE